jgi:hypothetical protein
MCQREKQTGHDKNQSEKPLILLKFFILTNNNITPFAQAYLMMQGPIH